MEDVTRDKSFVVVAHRDFGAVTDDLKKYLNAGKCRNFLLIAHEFSTLKTRRSFFERYEGGRLVEKHYSTDYAFLPGFLVNTKDFLYTLVWLLLKTRKIDVYIGLGGFNVVPGSLLKRLKRIDRIIFYTIDYAPVRFENRLLNELYHLIDRYEVGHASETWNISPRMAEGREVTRGLSPKDYPNQVVVPIGLWFDDVKRVAFTGINKTELIYIGNLLPKMGVQVVLEAIPQIVKEIPGFAFRIIGGGEYESRLKELARELEIEQHVIFEGPIPDQERANEKLAHAALAVAMYDRRVDDFTYYADPGKIKTYLSAGLPILMTDLPYNAEEIDRLGCGKVVDYDKDSLARAVIDLMGDEERLKEYRENALEYARRLDWNEIFKNNLERVLSDR